MKPRYPFNTYHSLVENINQYNIQLRELGLRLNVTVIDFHVTEDHIGEDRMHLHFYHKNLVRQSILNYLDYLSSVLAAVTVKIVTRTPEAKARRNHRRHIKQTLKQQSLCLTRLIEPPWSLTAVKQYLKNNNIKFAKIPPIFRGRLHIQFNNTIDLNTTDERLPPDTFSQHSFYVFCSPPPVSV